MTMHSQPTRQLLLACLFLWVTLTCGAAAKIIPPDGAIPVSKVGPGQVLDPTGVLDQEAAQQAPSTPVPVSAPATAGLLEGTTSSGVAPTSAQAPATAVEAQPDSSSSHPAESAPQAAGALSEPTDRLPSTDAESEMEAETSSGIRLGLALSAALALVAIVAFRILTHKKTPPQQAIVEIE